MEAVNTVLWNGQCTATNSITPGIEYPLVPILPPVFQILKIWVHVYTLYCGESWLLVPVASMHHAVQSMAVHSVLLARVASMLWPYTGVPRPWTSTDVYSSRYCNIVQYCDIHVPVCVHYLLEYTHVRTRVRTRVLVYTGIFTIPGYSIPVLQY